MQIGIIGAGKIGATVGLLWVRAGHQVRWSSRHPGELTDLVKKAGKGASTGTPEDAARFGEVVMISVPLLALPNLARELGSTLRGKVVLDTSNAYPQRDGESARIATAHAKGSAGWAADLFPGVRLVKAFNTVNFKTLEAKAHASGDRVGIPLASDDTQALEVAERLVREAGFDPVVVGDLVRGQEFEPGTPVYNTGMTGSDVRRALQVK